MAAGRAKGTRARSRARRLVLQGLYQWQLAGTPAADIGAQLLAGQSAHDLDIEFFHALLVETIGGSATIQDTFVQHLDRPLEQIDPVEHAILLLGACELRSHPEVPFRVVLNEAVELAKKFGAEDSGKYINAVLERVARDLRPAEFASRWRAAEQQT
ncbi:MAG: transcription antitermination factor NusB [Gammaproteobacteria bacterium]